MVIEKKSPPKGGMPPVTPKADVSDRQKALELALSQIEKQFGKGSIMKLGRG